MHWRHGAVQRHDPEYSCGSMRPHAWRHAREWICTCKDSDMRMSLHVRSGATSDALHIEVTGRGPPIVLLHGWGLHGGVFAPLVERLSDRFTLHCVDLPGHGRSRASAMPLQLDACVAHIANRTPPALWLGWSLGGLFALHAATTRPGCVQGLAMICATPRFVRAHDWMHAVDDSVFAQFARDLQQDHRGTLERFIALDTLGSEHAREELRFLRQTLYAHGEPAAAALRAGLTLLQTTDLRPALPALACPSLWISGRRDRLVPSAGVEDAVRMARDATHLPIARGSHVPFVGQADVVARAIDVFANSLDRHSREGGNPRTLAFKSASQDLEKVHGSSPSRG